MRRLLLSLIMAAAVASAGEPAGPEGLAALANKSARADRGLCLILGDADGRLTAALAKGGRMYVQVMVRDRERAAKLRLALAEVGPAERVSAIWQRTAHLPYLDDLLNLIVVSDWGSPDRKGLTLDDVTRALCPGGVALVGSDAGSSTDAAALLAEAVKAKLATAEKLDRTGAWIRITKQMNPEFGEWSHLLGGPEQTRVSADKVFSPLNREIRWCQGPVWGGSFRSAVYAGGRSFHQEATWLSPSVSHWTLVARDAHNGCELWRERITPGASIPAFCADDKYVYCVNGNELVGRDAATGKVVRKYGPSPVSVVALDDCLLIGSNVVEKETGKTRWTRKSVCQPAGAAGVVYIFDGKGIEAVNLADGKTIWNSAPKELAVPAYSRAVFVKADTVFVDQAYLEGRERRFVVAALERTTGALRWSRAREAGTVLPYAEAVYLVGMFSIKGNPGPKYSEWDIKTGKDVRTLDPTTFTGGRCWSPTATERFITGLEESVFFDRKTFTTTTIGRGIRSQCKIGPAFAYGLMYDLPHVCNCGTVLRGVSAISGGNSIPKGEVAPALISIAPAPPAAVAGLSDWPVYRGNPARSSSVSTDLPAELKLAWSAVVGRSALTQATGAGKLAFVAEPEAHRVAALELATGKIAWTFFAEGRVTVAPTLHKGLCLFSDHAGWVYCLEAATGRPVWQLQAAPEQRYMCAFGQPESSWPVRSGVLVVGETAFFSAGRTGITDGGLHIYAVDPASGKQRWKRDLARLMPNDLLVSNGSALFLERMLLNPADGTDARLQRGWTDNVLRSYGYEQRAGNAVLDLLSSADPGQIWLKKSAPGNSRGSGDAVAFDKDRTVFTFRPREGHNPAKEGALWRCQVRCAGASTWTNKTAAQQMLGMVLAGPRVYCVGLPEFRDNDDKPALWILSSTDGKELQRLPLESAPVVDGLSAIGGRLVMTTVDGQVLCFGAR